MKNITSLDMNENEENAPINVHVLKSMENEVGIVEQSGDVVVLRCCRFVHRGLPGYR